MSSGWIIRYSFSFCRPLPERCDLHHDAGETSSEEELGEANKRRVEMEEAQEAELHK